MKKNISYRDKLLELVSIYRITEVQNYIKNKKRLTTPQIELILKKNNVPIPTEINKSILEIQAKKITKPIYKAGNKIGDTADDIAYGFTSSFSKIIKGINNFFVFLLQGVINFFSSISKFTITVLNKAYYFKDEERKTSKYFVQATIISFITLFLIGVYSIKNIIIETEDVQLNTKKIIEKKSEPNKEVAKIPKIGTKEKKPESKKEVAKIPKKESKVKEFVLPDLNLKTRTVLTLFEDVNYDLKKVRNNKLVKPIYFTQFPKDLDEISSVQLKKETFIKIVLPLVVAENEKIFNDKLKLKRIMNKKMTNEKEKSWLIQKLKEYKVKKGSIKELEKRMDIIPISIAIAQAAKESGWGTSRFALEGNAIFGQWTWSGSGIAPLDRSKEKKHKILKFPILRASVKAYKNNLNTHKGYKKFREKRFQLRERNKSIQGIKLIHSLDNYAETGEEYTKILAQIIEQNSLSDFEGVKLTNSVVRKELQL